MKFLIQIVSVLAGLCSIVSAAAGIPAGVYRGRVDTFTGDNTSTAYTNIHAYFQLTFTTDGVMSMQAKVFKALVMNQVEDVEDMDITQSIKENFPYELKEVKLVFSDQIRDAFFHELDAPTLINFSIFTQGGNLMIDIPKEGLIPELSVLAERQTAGYVDFEQYAVYPVGS